MQYVLKKTLIHCCINPMLCNDTIKNKLRITELLLSRNAYLGKSVSRIITDV